MLTLFCGAAPKDCDGVSRRDFLRVGAVGLGGSGALNLAGLLESRAIAAAGELDFVRDRSVVLLYLSGGASHIETFNPNMTAPAPFRSMTGEVKTSLPGVSFGGTFPRMAKLAHRLAVVRSFQHSVGDHVAAHVHVLSGGTDPRGTAREGFSVGSFYSRLRGANDPQSGMPSFSVLVTPEVDGQYRKEVGRVLKGSTSRELGPLHAPFVHEVAAPGGAAARRPKRRRGAESSIAADMTLSFPEARLLDRRALLNGLDRLRSHAEGSEQLEAATRYQQQAFDVLLGGAAEAFDVARESPKLLERYDTSDVQIGHRAFRPSTLGHQMLLARRLCEAGCGFVTVHSAGWDMHADGNNPGMIKGMNMLGTTLDRAVSAFLTDLDARGLGDKILLVITGDFGRTPKVNARGGRDHWARLGTLAFAGGGLSSGGVVGRSDRKNGEPATDPVTPRHMMATIVHSLFDIGQLRLAAGLPRDLLQFVEGMEPIRELV